MLGKGANRFRTRECPFDVSIPEVSRDPKVLYHDDALSAAMQQCGRAGYKAALSVALGAGPVEQQRRAESLR